MVRLALVLPVLSLAMLPAGLAAQTAAPDMADALDVVPIDCTLAGEGTACTIRTERPVTFCMAVDASGAPVANSTGATDAGEILFQNVDPSRIVGLRCRET